MYVLVNIVSNKITENTIYIKTTIKTNILIDIKKRKIEIKRK